MEQNPNAPATRVCEWCGESIPQQALRCPRCHQWRKDIAEDRVKFYMVVAMFFSLCAVLGFYIGSNIEQWRVRQLKTEILPGAYGLPVLGTKEEFVGFSINKFLSDPLIIVLGVGIIILSIVCCYYWNKISRKAGSSL